MADTSRNLTLNTLVGKDSEFRGELKVKDLVRIDGYFEGSIITDGKVLVGNTGVVYTDIKASVVIIGGRVHGSVYATQRLTLLSTCYLYGNIVAYNLFAEEGCTFKGHCTISP